MVKEDRIEEAIEFVKEGTKKHRDDLLQEFRKMTNSRIILFLIEEFKSYCYKEHGGDWVTAGQYMVILDAAQTVLTERNFLIKIDTWTLEEFLDEKPFHSVISEENE